ncbi:MAG: hypothetical protein AVDCRST_MAG50-2292 [uncultured Acidimicrobiales bacterium]|uniref:Carboxylic ester hydrolase n=1 Tax=uncultured Acidimicrobiales bacterium TaxID=310071 RepID=A0A6J4IIT9_9ACTN|nr:MAG: hypothetical protein AVDCRST_MAG50-2292 [uncultured Acidimicrobiales bacterium]
MTASGRVVTASGALRGDVDDSRGLTVFRGVPYAAPPVGDRRFRAPQPVEPWDGVRDALAFGPAAVQPEGQPSMFGGLFGSAGLGVSEDCLTLNVWTPAVDDRRRPTMVWIHGGAFRMGTAGAGGYDGSELARRGDVVVVSLNYRLGLLGFLCSPELGAANAGLLDQVAALEWVHREIARFGGDPDQVTVFGESAGGKSIECLLAMPAARGLFSRAILQSTYSPPMDVEAAAQRARDIAAELGAGSADLEILRSAPVDALLAAEQRAAAAATAEGRTAPSGAGPVVDGTVLPRLPIEAVLEGSAASVPLLLGTTLDESRLFGALAPEPPVRDDETLAARLVSILPGDDPHRGRRAAAEYRRARSERGESIDPVDIWFAASTDATFRQHSIRLAEAYAARQPDTWMYLFSWASTSNEGRLGAFHAVELPFVFGTFDEPLGRLAGDSPEARSLGEAVQDAWLAFACTGRPKASALPDWPPYEPGRRATMVLGATCEVVEAPMDDERRLWESLQA